MTNPLEDLKNQMARAAFGAAPSDIPGHCIGCRDPFTSANVFTEAGRRETKISGLCERCFDEITKDIDEDFPDDQEENS